MHLPFLLKDSGLVRVVCSSRMTRITQWWSRVRLEGPGLGWSSHTPLPALQGVWGQVGTADCSDCNAIGSDPCPGLFPGGILGHPLCVGSISGSHRASLAGGCMFVGVAYLAVLSSWGLSQLHLSVIPEICFYVRFPYQQSVKWILSVWYHS